METVFVRYKGREDIGIVINRVGDLVEASFAYCRIIANVNNFEIVLVESLESY